MFRRGFKASCEEIAVKIRHRLEIPPDAPIDPAQIAGLLSIPILSPRDLAELPPDAQARLVSDHSSVWSAITVSDGRRHLIVLNSSHASTRINSSLAHELAHVLLAHDPSMMFVTPQSGVALRTHNREQEDEANWLAGCILLPRDALLRIRRIGLSDEQVCETYGVSPAMLRFRVNATGVDVHIRRLKGYRTGPSR